MSSGLMAMRYARALVGLVADPERLKSLRTGLEEVSVALQKNMNFRRQLTRPDTDLESKQKVIEDVLQSDYPTLLVSLIDDLIARRRLTNLPAISREFTRMVDKKLGILRAVVTSPLALTAAMRQDVLNGLMQTHTGTVELVEKVDPALLGGLSIQAGHRLLDTSVRAELRALKQSLFHSTIS